MKSILIGLLIILCISNFIKSQETPTLISYLYSNGNGFSIDTLRISNSTIVQSFDFSFSVNTRFDNYFKILNYSDGVFKVLYWEIDHIFQLIDVSENGLVNASMTSSILSGMEIESNNIAYDNVLNEIIIGGYSKLSGYGYTYTSVFDSVSVTTSLYQICKYADVVYGSLNNETREYYQICKESKGQYFIYTFDMDTHIMSSGTLLDNFSPDYEDIIKFAFSSGNFYIVISDQYGEWFTIYSLNPQSGQVKQIYNQSKQNKITYNNNFMFFQSTITYLISNYTGTYSENLTTLDLESLQVIQSSNLSGTALNDLKYSSTFIQ